VKISGKNLFWELPFLVPERRKEREEQGGEAELLFSEKVSPRQLRTDPGLDELVIWMVACDSGDVSSFLPFRQDF